MKKSLLVHVSWLSLLILAMLVAGGWAARASAPVEAPTLVGVGSPQPRETMPAPATIHGLVSYSGAFTGTHIVWVGAFTTTLGGPPAFSTQFLGVGPYTLTVQAGTYYLYAGMDGDDSAGPPNPTIDPMGAYPGNPVSLSAGQVITNADIALRDPNQPPPGAATIHGVISYSGAITGTHIVWVGAFTTTQGGPPAFSTQFFGVGPYTLTVQAGAYYLRAGMDGDDSAGPPNPTIDPLGAYPGNPVNISAGQVISGADIALHDPNQNPEGASISGLIGYSGRITITHTIIVVAVRPGEQQPAYHAFIVGPGPYTMTQVAAGVYFVGAFMDVGEDMGPPEPDEPFGWYDLDGNGPDPVAVEGSAVTGISILLRDPLGYVYLPLARKR